MEPTPFRARWARPWRVSAATLVFAALMLTLSLLCLAQAQPSAGALAPLDEPLGACCLPDGSCTQTGEADCRNNLSGVYQGDGVACSAASCALGACCLPDGSCVESSPSMCLANGGAYQGEGIACASASCIPAPTGACCLPDGSCRELAETQCALAGGVYQGNDTSCATSSCLGACCLLDGSCVQDTLAGCEAQGGAYQGLGVTCAEADCQPAAIGACCLPDGSCQQATEADCRNTLNGVYHGDGVACSAVDCTGACCLPDGSCVAASQVNCVVAGGVYRGDGVACGDILCSPAPTGACCLPDGSCLTRTEAQCEMARGLYQGDGTTCTASTCAGACCLADGSCVEDTLAGCIAREGVFKGGGTTCATASCAPLVMGACCFPDGSCQQLEQSVCEAAFGTFQGAGVSCEDAPCVTGACCWGDFTAENPGQCDELAPFECAALRGFYAGDGTTCSEPTCSPFTMRFTVSPSAFTASPMQAVYTIWITNESTVTATLRTLTSTLVSVFVGQGECALPHDIGPGATFECEYSAQVHGPVGEPLADIVTARLAAGDDGREYLVDGYMDYGLAVNKVDRNDPWYAGWILNYDIYILNTGVMTLTNVVVTDTVAQPWSLVVSPTGSVGGVVVWNVGELAPNGRRQLTLQVQNLSNTPHNTTITNTVRVAANELADAVTDRETTLLLQPPTPTPTSTPTPTRTPTATRAPTPTITPTPAVTVEPPRIYLPMTLK